jgi:hypothetical protein
MVLCTFAHLTAALSTFAAGSQASQRLALQHQRQTGWSDPSLLVYTCSWLLILTGFWASWEVQQLLLLLLAQVLLILLTAVTPQLSLQRFSQTSFGRLNLAWQAAMQ